ncbi:hypothetical protein BTG95_07915 [Acinetobacter baumannii]|uniref:peroxide stress protein YaaA n=1 Tax=Acinetobacter baumannii TaxID=470 RepID=UPI0009933D97|nr:peroxide stress protein YaaA [Acinetobacter baumannii]OOT83769.1 hypothetical protein BTG95_07915 [Acinetobacter baumannii]
MAEKPFTDRFVQQSRFYAKKARGLMARFIIENQLNKAEDIKAFNTEGYYFDADNSSAKELVFKRDEQ